MTLTQPDVVARIKARQPQDVLGFEWHEYLRALDFEHAKEWLNPDVAVDWDREVEPLTREHWAKVIADYVPFAWGKANDCRGISAGRSVSHFIAWAWLAGDAEFADELERTEHQFYGKPALVKVCRKYGIDWRKLDNGRWTNFEGDDGIAADAALAAAGIEVAP